MIRQVVFVIRRRPKVARLHPLPSSVVAVLKHVAAVRSCNERRVIVRNNKIVRASVLDWKRALLRHIEAIGSYYNKMQTRLFLASEIEKLPDHIFLCTYTFLPCKMLTFLPIVQ